MSADTFSRLRRDYRDLPLTETNRWLSRAEVQISFARMLCTVQTAEKAKKWTKLIDDAEGILAKAPPGKGIEGLKEAVGAVEKALAEIGKEAKTYKVHCVGHGHIDMNWMWSWPETVSTTHDTFASVLSLMDQYPKFTYTQSQASVYALVEKHFPEMFDKIKVRVKEGRWEVAAVHWVEGDKNIASGESLCNHLLRTRTYFAEKFGLKPEDVPIDWEPDTFGHANTIPGFLSRAGVKYYYCCRPGGGCEHTMIGKPRPAIFYWKGLDGSKVLVYQDETWYGSNPKGSENIAAPVIRIQNETGLREWMYVYGVGNHGGGPTRAAINYLLFMQDWPIYPIIEFSTVKRYCDSISGTIEKDKLTIPVLDHELNFEFTGCYTSQSLIKQANRFGENYLVEAETMATIAHRITGQSYQSELLKEGWINTIFNHFHDILPGSGVRDTRERAMGMFQEVGAITGAIKRRSGVGLMASLNTASLLPDTREAKEELKAIEKGEANAAWESAPGAGANLTGLSRTSTGGRKFFPVVIYNPCAWVRSEPVQVSLYDIDIDPARVVARDEKGNTHPLFYLRKTHYWGHDEYQYLFTPKDVPALGYRTYLFMEGDATVQPSETTVLPREWFETGGLKVQFDRNQSGLLNLNDKKSGWNFEGSIEDSLGEWQFLQERNRGMTAWIMGRPIEKPVNLVANSYVVHGSHESSSGVPGGSGEGVIIERDLVVPGTNSTVKLRALVHALKPRIDFVAEIDWREIGTANETPALRISFPVGKNCKEAIYETAFGSVHRDECEGEEVPSLRYAHVPNGKGGITLLQDCKYGHMLKDGRLTLTIVRSSTDPDHAPEVARSIVRYSIVLHDKPADAAMLTRLGMEWNHPLMVLPANMQKGTVSPVFAGAECLTPNIVLTALKMSEDDKGLIVRLVEYNGKPTEAKVKLNTALVKGYSKATLVDLVERTIKGDAKLEGDTLTVNLPAHGIVTVKLT